MKTSTRSPRAPFVSSSTIVVGSLVGALGASVVAATSAHKETMSIVFQENFDDDELGAVPLGVESDGAASIENDYGFVEGLKASAATLLNVVREDATDIGNCLAIGDLDPGPGGAMASFVPSRGMVDTSLGISFEVRREATSIGSGLYLSAIDNRTTPGTGRLLALGFVGLDGKFEISGKPQNFSLKNGATYRVEIDLDLSYGPDDSWGIKITNLHDPADQFAASHLRTQTDGAELSAFVVSAFSDQALFAYVDNFEIVQFLD